VDKRRVTIPPQERYHGLGKILWCCGRGECTDVRLEIDLFVPWNHPTPHFLRKHNFFSSLHLRDQVVEQPETCTGVVMLPLVSEGRAPCKEVAELLKPGVRFFRDITEILRVDGKWGVVGSSQGCLMEGMNLSLELFSIHR
jgi:hypothetical protein